jgi:hypothetical protein
VDLKALIARLGRMIGLGPTSELARPSEFGTGHTGDDRGERYLRRPRAHGTSEQQPQRPGRHHPDMPTVEPDPLDFQSPGGEVPMPKRRPPRPFRSKGDE